MIIRALIVCLCLSGTLSSQARAGAIVAGDIVRLSQTGDYGGAGGGGAFTIERQIAGGQWELLNVKTFCLELNEHFSPGQPLLVGALSDRAILGGVVPNNSSSTSSDILDIKTAYLYENFAKNSTDLLSAIGVGGNWSGSWSNALQEAIWHLEGEVSGTASSNAQKLIDFANAATITTSAVGKTVFVLNLFAPGTPIPAGFDPANSATWGSIGTSTYLRQDQIFYQPHAPEPSSGVLWLSAMCLLAGRARVRAKRSI
ncbi:MAG: hypothetical protein ABI557_20590 [Aureliella sp.]